MKLRFKKQNIYIFIRMSFENVTFSDQSFFNDNTLYLLLQEK